MKTVKDIISERALLFDGAMGTYFAECEPTSPVGCEEAILSYPEKIYRIHREYLAAGADALKTDSFCLPELYLIEPGKAKKIISKSFEVASKAVSDFGGDRFVFADIGPVFQSDGISFGEVYRRVAGDFIKAGAVNFLFETMQSPDGLADTCKYIKEELPDSFITVSFAVSPDGFTQSGHSGETLAREFADCEYVDAVGFNCLSGPSHMEKLVTKLVDCGKPVSAMPNAGYPTRDSGMAGFGGSAAYFASTVRRIALGGAKIVGGCCGTTPDFIRQLRRLLDSHDSVSVAASAKTAATLPSPVTPVWEKQECIAVELDPPDNAQIGSFVAGAAALCEAGADAVTIADCPISRARADSSILAAKLHRELGITAIPHMTCRDRNLNATKALLLGLGIEGVNHVLTVTGDPVPTDDRNTVKRVYNFSSPRLAAFIRDLGNSEGGASFAVAGALNVNAVNFEAQLRHAKEKISSGVTALFTQPVMTDRALENLARAKEELDAKLLCGIMPIVSHRNALYMDAEISGISVDKAIIDRYEGLDREAGENLAVEICSDIADRAKPHCDGFYLITPFRRVELICRIIREIKE